MKLTDANRPLRVLDKVLKGGLGPGNIGVVMARHGTGKLAVLTSIALDHAMDKRNTLHVGINESVADVRAYHDEVLNEIMESLDLPDRGEIQTMVERHKIINTFRDGRFTLERLRDSLNFLRGGPEFAPEMIEMQGWPDFENMTQDDLLELKKIAEDYKCEIWIPAHTHREDSTDTAGMPDYVSRFADHLEVIIALEPQAEQVMIQVLKAHGEAVDANLNLEFDPKTMLIRWR